MEYESKVNSPEWCMALLGMNMHRGFYTASGVYGFSGTMNKGKLNYVENYFS